MSVRLRVRAGLLLGLLSFGVAGCSSRPGTDVLTPVLDAAPVGQRETVLVATTRKRSPDQDDAFTTGRAQTLNYGEYTISVPPNHKVGEVEFPQQGKLDPATSFVVTNTKELPESGFKAAIAHVGGDVIVFVHGYNTNFQEALFRQAQLVHDRAAPQLNRQPISNVLFAWPSQGTLTGYLADRESSTYSRDYLEQVLNEIANVPNVRNIHLAAHSMGNWLAVETLRQAKMRGHSPFLAKLGDVLLLSPDIDIDVFRTQLDAIGRLKRPITVVLNKNDLALAASQRLAGDVPRVGNFLIDNPRAQAAIKKYDLKVVDVSQVKSLDSLGHSNFVSALPALQQIAQSSVLAGQDQPGLPGVFVINATGEILSTPLRVGKALMGQ